MRQSRPRSGGWDVHTDSRAGASSAQAHGAEVISRGAIDPRQWDLAPRLRTMPATATHLLVVDAAGPGGSWLSQDVTQPGDAGGVGAPQACPHRPVTASTPTVGTPCHWPGWRARGRSPWSMSPPEQRPPAATSRGPVTIPAALCRTPRGDATLASSATIAAPPAGPMGARPLSAGARQGSVPPQRTPSSCQQRSEPSTPPPHASSVSHTHATSPCNRGVGPRWSPAVRPGAGCHAWWPSRWGLTGATAAVARPPEP